MQAHHIDTTVHRGGFCIDYYYRIVNRYIYFYTVRLLDKSTDRVVKYDHKISLKKIAYKKC